MKTQHTLSCTTLVSFALMGLLHACAAPQPQQTPEPKTLSSEHIKAADQTATSQTNGDTVKNKHNTDQIIDTSTLTPSSIKSIDPDTVETGGPVIVPLADLGINIPKTTRETLAKQWTLTSNDVHPTKTVITLHPITQGDMGQVDIEGPSPFEGKIAYWAYRNDNKILFFDQEKTLVWTAHKFGPNMFQARYGASTRYRLTPANP